MAWTSNFDVQRLTVFSLVLPFVGVILLPVGWILVFVSGYGGNSTGGSEIVWRIGGLTVYASVLMLLIAAVIHVARLAVVAARHLRAARS